MNRQCMRYKVKESMQVEERPNLRNVPSIHNRSQSITFLLNTHST